MKACSGNFVRGDWLYFEILTTPMTSRSVGVPGSVAEAKWRPMEFVLRNTFLATLVDQLWG